jgi:hypothetical protein
MLNQDRLIDVKEKIKKIADKIDAQTNSVFVGSENYPNINIGILNPLKKSEEFDDPKAWIKKNLNIDNIFLLRSQLINTKKQIRALDKNDFTGKVQELSLSAKPIEVELKLKNKPTFSFRQSSYYTPFGSRADIERAELLESPKIQKAVEDAHSDTELKSDDALKELYKKGYDEYFLSKALSTGSFGIGNLRKFVPTRWSITATDDILSKDLINKIKEFDHAGNCAFFGELLGNYYLILLTPNNWSYELFEIDLRKGNSVATDYEGFEGRKNYAKNTCGGYYAARLAIAEKLLKLKKQASVVAIRFITKDYYVGLGVWVVREAARLALNNKIEFGELNLMLKYAELMSAKKFNYNLEKILKSSTTLKNIKEQSTLTKFFS